MKMGSRLLVLWLAMVMVLVGLSKGDLDKDKQQCAQKLIELSACLPYVSGQAKGPPTPACCDALKPVLQTSKVCLCILIKDRDDPKLGIKINANLALGLPDSCHLPSNITECPKLLNLSPKSPEAKIFEDYKSNNATAASSDTCKAHREENQDQVHENVYLRVEVDKKFDIATLHFGNYSIWYFTRRSRYHTTVKSEETGRIYCCGNATIQPSETIDEYPFVLCILDLLFVLLSHHSDDDEDDFGLDDSNVDD
ncbi:YLS3-like protein [Tanacetum coccineum]